MSQCYPMPNFFKIGYLRDSDAEELPREMAGIVPPDAFNAEIGCDGCGVIRVDIGDEGYPVGNGNRIGLMIRIEGRTPIVTVQRGEADIMYLICAKDELMADVQHPVRRVSLPHVIPGYPGPSLEEL